MRLITCRNLGGIGRFGNMCFTYCFAKAYAERYGAELHTSDWIGRKIFLHATEPLVSDKTLPQTMLDSKAAQQGIPLDRYFGRTSIDIRVYAQHQVYVDFYTRAKAREWLTLKPEYEALSKGPSGSVAHMRRGEYVDNESFKNVYAAVTEASYDRAVAEFGIPAPVTKVFEGWRENDPSLPPELSWLPDFLLLRDATHLLRANSTFSWWAAVLGKGRVYSPLVEDKVGWQDVKFVEGNHPNLAGKNKNQSDLYLRE